ncbi:hypothetical protein [Candidatus Ichthyocystis hellenicum]|uniref:hypothetical protein n=1 Tax=Candidatus Ichthyocystis hellenicum TaxID=1561003 RepID=UPI000B8812C4|nr:hypothetical protein [Candidatus Ichthyocystis hellenicum]
MAYGNDRQVGCYRYCARGCGYDPEHEQGGLSVGGASALCSGLTQTASSSTYHPCSDHAASSVPSGVCPAGLPQVTASVSSFGLPLITASPYSLHLARALCYGYGFSICPNGMDGVSNDDFFKGYATSSGYRFPDVFLSSLNEYKVEFLSVVNKILCDSRIGLHVESFGGSLDTNVSAACRVFSEIVYTFVRPECVSVLRSKFIPKIIKTILGAVVVDSGGERAMSSSEMEQFFLYYVTILERLIMVTVMDYWNKFWSSQQRGLPPSFLSASCKNPFVYSSFYGNLAIPVVAHPAAFTLAMGECVSFFAAFKIKDMIEYLSNKYYDELRIIVHDRILSISRSSYYYHRDFEEFMALELPTIVRMKFDEMMAVDVNWIRDFLSGFIIWSNQGIDGCSSEVNLSRFLQEIVCSVFHLLTRCTDTFCINFCKNYVLRVKKYFLKVGDKDGSQFKRKWGLDITPTFGYNVSSVVKEFSVKIKLVIYAKFCQIIKDNFPRYYWSNISDRLLPIAKEEAKEILAERYRKLSQLVSEASVATPGGIARITKDEGDRIMEIIIQYENRKLINLLKILWSKAVASSGGYVSSGRFLRKRVRCVPKTANP